MSEALEWFVDWVWGAPLVLTLIGGGTGLFFYSGAMPLRGFFHAWAILLGRAAHQGDSQAKGQLSHFQALTNAIAATVGLGNISGVAVALTQGGPGAIFWMWVAAIVGMNTKFFECTLSVMYRGVDYRGEVQGGPMYVIASQLPKYLKFLAPTFAICGLIGCMALFQTNQLAGYAKSEFGWPPILIGIIGATFVLVVIHGGVKRLGSVTAAMVPSMTLLYVSCALTILFLNSERIPEVFAQIFKEAFTGRAAMGGALGWGFLEVMKTGVKRAAFSNEAGVGTAPMAHSNVRTNEPVSEGLVAMLEPFIDTIVVCTMTALVILVSVPPEVLSQGVEGIQITALAFEQSLGPAGRWIIGICILMFASSTMLGMANYNLKCWNFLFRGRRFLGQGTFFIFFCGTMVWASVAEVSDVVNVLDIGYGLMAYPNMLATLWLAHRVRKATLIYLKTYL